MGVLRVGSCCSLSSALLTTALFPPEINITKDSHSRSNFTFDPRFLAASVVDIVVVVHHQHKTSRDKITTKKTNLWPLLLNWLPPHPTPPIVAAPSPSPPLPPTLRRLG